MSLGQIGVLLGVLGIVRFLVEVPSGYISDVVSRRLCLVLMGVFAATGMAVLVLVPTVLGAYIALILETVGYAFWSGTNSAIVHDSLSLLGKKTQYSKFMNKVQSVSLIANAVLISGAVATYTVDKRLPFVIGFVQFCIMTVCGYFNRDIHIEDEFHVLKPINTSWLKRHKGFIIFALLAGIVNVTYTAPSTFRNIAYESFGVPAETLGLVFAAASIVAAFYGLFAHYLNKLRFKQYMLIDALISSIFGGLMIATGNAILAVFGFIVTMSFWRFRGFYYQEKIINNYDTTSKATLLSIIVNSEELAAIWMPVVIGLVMASFGLQTGFLFVAIGTSMFFIPYILVANKEFIKVK